MRLQARFRQETRVPGLIKSRPGKTGVDSETGDDALGLHQAGAPKTIIANGDTLWIYLPEDRQVIRDHINHSLGTRTPALFLAGQGRLTDLFTVAGTSTQGPGEGGLASARINAKR